MFHIKISGYKVFLPNQTAEQLFGVDPCSEADCEYQLDYVSDLSGIGYKIKFQKSYFLNTDFISQML